MRALLKSIIALCTIFGVASSAFSQAYPSRPIRVVVPFASAGPPDILARVLGEKMSVALGQPVVIENRPGAGGNIGYAAAAKAAPDGYTVLLGSINTHAINPSLYASLPFDPVKDFQPVTLLARVHNVLVVNRSSPIKGVRELIAEAKARPGRLTYGSAGNGTTLHLAGELMKLSAGIDMVHVPYKSAPESITDLLASRIDLSFAGVPPAMAFIRDGRLTALAVTAPARIPQLPDVPTVAEAGLTGYEVVAWNGFLVPAGTPQSVVERLHAAAVKALSEPDVRERLVSLGFEPVGSSAAEFAKVIDQDIGKFSRVVKQSGIKIE